ncbi:MAG: acyl-CoA thioesterase [Candidatus Gastranaerophilales bacterium]|nr:acyl-CoA thioesterase [Candidatus Gastranaerophilales bacterium]
MKHALKQKVYYSDTDAYGVVWHGSYLRWLEMGRVELCSQSGYTVAELLEQDVVLPVAEINIKYKNSAKIDDVILVNTEIKETSKCSITFHQTITDENQEKTYIDATVKVVAINKSGKLYRSLPEQLKNMFS